MLRRIALLIPLIALLSLSGCLFFPHEGGWHGDRHYDGGHYEERR